VRAGVYLCATQNTHLHYLGLADDRRGTFSIVLVGDQIADSVVGGQP